MLMVQKIAALFQESEGSLEHDSIAVPFPVVDMLVAACFCEPVAQECGKSRWIRQSLSSAAGTLAIQAIWTLMSRSPLIPNCVFYSKALPLCSALFCALPSHLIASLCAAGGTSLDVASLGWDKSSSSPASPAAHLWLSGTPPHPSAASTHT